MLRKTTLAFLLIVAWTQFVEWDTPTVKAAIQSANQGVSTSDYLERRRVFWRALFLLGARYSTWSNSFGGNDFSVTPSVGEIGKRLMYEIGPNLRDTGGNRLLSEMAIAELADAYKWLMSEWTNPNVAIPHSKPDWHEKTPGGFKSEKAFEELWKFVDDEVNPALPKDDKGQPKAHDNHVLRVEEAEAIEKAVNGFSNKYNEKRQKPTITKEGAQEVIAEAEKVLRVAVEIRNKAQERQPPNPYGGKTEEERIEQRRRAEQIKRDWEERSYSIPYLLLPENLPPPRR